jgi:hypothetical protein
MARKKLLNPEEEKIIKDQLGKNALLISQIIAKIDLLMNKEGHNRDSNIVHDFRQKLDVLINENDTFRKVYWKHFQTAFETIVDADYEAVRYLVLTIRERNRFSSGVYAFDYQIGSE